MKNKALIASSVLAVLLSGCGDKNETNESQAASTSPSVVKEQVKVQDTPKEETVDKVVKTVSNAVQSGAKEVEQIAKDIQTSAQPIINDAAQKVKEVQKAVENTSIEDVKNKINEAASSLTGKTALETSKGGGELYAKCVSCHGAQAQNKALGKSEIIKGWDAQKIASALKGYQDGSYGGSMKGLMKSQVSGLSQKEIEVLSNHIASF